MSRVDTGTIIAIASTSVAAIIAVTVPWVTFRLTLRLDHTRWLREQRAHLYVDVLTEAHAEQKYLEYALADDETRERMHEHFDDLRLPPLERARLGARGTLFGSRAVNALANQIQTEGLRAMLGPRRDEGVLIATRVKVGRIADALEAAARREIGVDRLPLTTEESRPPSGLG